MSRYFHSFFTLLLLTALAPQLRAGDAVTPAQFKAITAKAQDMDHTTPGENYMEHFQDAVRAQVGEALKACTARTTPPYWIDIVVVIVDGKVQELVPDPESPQSICVASKLGHLTVPSAPRREWMQLLDIHIEK